MLGFEAAERFGDSLLSVEVEYSVSYPIILPKEEVFFTYTSQKEEEDVVIVPGEICRRNLATGEITKKLIQEEITEDVLATMTGNQEVSPLTGRELFKMEKELLSCYEQIWENYYQTKESEKNFLQKRWKELFDILVKDGPVLKMYQYFGREMLEK